MKYNIEKLDKMTECTENLFRASDKSFAYRSEDGEIIVTLSVKKGANDKVMATPQYVFFQNEAGEFVKETGSLTKEPRTEASVALASYIEAEGLTFEFAEGVKRKATKPESFLNFMAKKYGFDVETEREEFNKAQEEKKMTNAAIEEEIAALRAKKIV